MEIIGISRSATANAAKGAETAAQLLESDITLGDGAKRASDIHLEPAPAAYRIRLRIDGVLHILQDIAKETACADGQIVPEISTSLNIGCRRTQVNYR